jgi:hypothetical protein
MTDALLTSLAVPAEFAKYEDIDNSLILRQLDDWKNASTQALRCLRETLLHPPSGTPQTADLSLNERAHIASVVSGFKYKDVWTNDVARRECEGKGRSALLSGLG